MYVSTSIRTIDDQTRDKNALNSRIDFLLIFRSSFLIIIITDIIITRVKYISKYFNIFFVRKREKKSKYYHSSLNIVLN